MPVAMVETRAVTGNGRQGGGGGGGEEVSAEATAVMCVMGVAADWAGAVETEAAGASTTNRCASSGNRQGAALPSLPGRRPSRRHRHR